MKIYPSNLLAAACILLFGNLCQLQAGMMGANMIVTGEYLSGGIEPAWTNLFTQNITVADGVEFLLPYGLQVDVSDTSIMIDYAVWDLDPGPVRLIFSGPAGIFTGLQVSSNSFPAPPGGTNVLDVISTQATFNFSHIDNDSNYQAVLDGVSPSSTVPEPQGFALTGAGVTLLSFALRRMRRHNRG